MNTERRFSKENTPYLPPREYWRFTPGKDERIPTPTDERGLVNADGLILAVNSALEPEFSWDQTGISNIHHLYWERNRYPHMPECDVDPYAFCEAPVNQIIIPMVFHKFLHIVMAEPEVPSKEVMRYRLEVDHVVRKLARIARLHQALLDARYMPDDKLHRGGEYLVWQFLIEVEEAQKLPVEFHTVDFSELSPSSPEDLRSFTHLLENAIARPNRSHDIRSGFMPIAA